MEQQSTHFDKFTEHARAALVVAQREAQRRGQALIEPEHLLLGILHQPQDTAGWICSELGIVPKMVSTSVEARLPAVVGEQAEARDAEASTGRFVIDPALSAAGPAQALSKHIDAPGYGTPVVPQLSPRSKQVIALAVSEFTALRHPVLATGHFLLGLLREKQGSAFFSTWGINLRAARAQMKRVTRQALLAEQRRSPLVRTTETESEQEPGVLKMNLDRQEGIVKQRKSVHRALWLYYLVLGVIAFGVIEFILQSSQILTAYRILAANLAATPGLAWQPIAGWRPLLVLLYYLVISCALMIVALPLHWYISTVIPERNGLYHRTTGQWLRMVLNRTFWLMYLVGALLVELVTWLMLVQPRSWWAWAALAPTLFFVLMGLFGSSRFAFWTKSIIPLSEGEVFTRFQALRERLELPACGLYQFQVSQRTSVANAFFAGWGPGRRVILTDTMLQQFPPDEIEVIIAHELGHCAHHDIWTNFLMSGLISLGIFGLIDLYLNTLTALATSSALSALLQPLYFVLGIIGFLILLRLNIRYRRYKEYRADEYALRAIQDVQLFKSAMTRLTQVSMPRRRIRQAPATTHPSLVKRLRHADEFARTVPQPQTLSAS